MDQKPTKYMLITGAAGGIGRATVNLFAERDWRVIGVDRQPFGDGFPESGQFIQADISEPSQLEAIFEQAKGFTDTLDALINNAALQITKPLIETTVEKVRKLYRYVGFEEYHKWEDTEAGIDVWFLERKVNPPKRD
jgi:NAD(P)-dependent dehydrogenase (short-subunit alcohol dehydrogenase family)